MSARARVSRARALLIATVGGAALLWAAIAFAGIVTLVAVADQVTPWSAAARSAARTAAALAALIAAARVLWRGRHARDASRVALYLEERVPSLSYALVTAIGYDTEPPALQRQLAGIDLSGVLRPGIVRALVIPVLVAAALAAGFAAMPSGALARVLSPRPGDVLTGRAGDARANRLSAILVRVTPPAYTGERPREDADPSSVAALAGSTIQVRGRGAAAGLDSLTGVLADRPLAATSDGDEWSFAFALPDEPAALRLRDRAFERLIALEPVPDLSPVVTLLSPSRDSLYRTPAGRIALAASAQDDIGLARAVFEVLHTSGSGERYRTGRQEVAAVTLGRVRTTRITGDLRLDTMRLGPGDVLHIRAVAADRRTRGGPGVGFSDTRTIRIADPRRQDTVSIQLALEIPLDTSVLSQRALIMRAETLLRRERRLGAAQFRRQGLDLNDLQRALRERVEEVIEEIENESEDVRVGSTVVSRLLTQATYAMRDAERELGIADVRTALPHMYRALRLLQQARDATARYYLRGPLPKVVIDLARARLRGRDSADVTGRAPREAIPDGRRALLARLDRAVSLAAASRTAAADSLVLMRLAALAEAPDAADALATAATALRGTGDATPALRQARRALERRTTGTTGLAPWQAAP